MYIYSYLLGSVPTTYLIARAVKGMDLRQFGSGNVGGSNLYQAAGGKWLLFLVLSELLIKGGSPVWIGRHVLGLDQSPELLVVAPLLALAGNNWPVFLRFQGGRGVAVALGSLLALSLPLFAAFFTVGLAGWAATRNSGFWVLIAFVSLPLWAFLSPEPGALVWYTGALTGILVMKRLLTNNLSLPEGIPVGRLMLNRLLLDRDIGDRESWVRRAGGGTNGDQGGQ